MLPLLRKLPRHHQRSPTRNLLNSSCWQSNRTITLATQNEHSRSLPNNFKAKLGSVHRIRPGGSNYYLFRYPTGAAFSSETNDIAEEEKEEATTTPNSPTDEAISQKDEILQGFLEDLSKVREEVLEVVEEDSTKSSTLAHDEEKMPLGLENSSLRERYEGALEQHRIGRGRRNTSSNDWSTSSFSDSPQETDESLFGATSQESDDGIFSSSSLSSSDTQLFTTDDLGSVKGLFSTSDDSSTADGLETNSFLEGGPWDTPAEDKSVSVKNDTGPSWLASDITENPTTCTGASSDVEETVGSISTPLFSDEHAGDKQLSFNDKKELFAITATEQDDNTSTKGEQPQSASAEDDSPDEVAWWTELAPVNEEAEVENDAVPSPSEDSWSASKKNNHAPMKAKQTSFGGDDTLSPPALETGALFPNASKDDALFNDEADTESFSHGDSLFPDAPESAKIDDTLFSTTSDSLFARAPENAKTDDELCDSLFAEAPESAKLDDRLISTTGGSLFAEAPESAKLDNEFFLDDDWETGQLNGQHEDEESSEIKDELAKICLLLENMTAKDWKLFDGGDDEDPDEEWGTEEDGDMEDSNELEMSAEESVAEADSDDESNSGLTQIEDFLSVLDISLFESKTLTTDECNLILARLATAPELSLDEIMDNLLDIYSLMIKHVAPNETTYKILLLTLDRRIGGGESSNDATIVTLLRDMINFRVKLSSGYLLNLGMECLERENNLEVARHLVMDYALDDQERSFRVPRNVARTLMKMFARENQLDEAIYLLKKCTTENGSDNSRDTDSVLDAALQWPDRNRAGQRRDITHVLQSFLEVIMKNNIDYNPGFSAYRNIIVALSRTTKGDITRWEKLRQPFHALFDNYSRFWPDEFLLRVGLNYSEATKDAELARTLVLRSVDHHAPEPTFEPSSSDMFSTEGFLNDPFETEEGQNGIGFDDLGGFSTNISSSGFDDLGGLSSDISSTSDSIWPNIFAAEDPPAARDDSDLLFPVESSGLDTGMGTELADENTPSESIESEATTLFATTVEEIGLHETNPPPTPPFSFKVFHKALKVCLAADDLQSSRDILDAYSRISDLYPKNAESDMWSFVLRGFASLGHNPDAIKELFDTMKLKEMKISEESYGAMIHSLAAGKRHEEASELFNAYRLASQDKGEAIGVSSYNAMILSHINVKAWDQVLSTYKEMKESGLSPNAGTTQSLLIASYRMGGMDQARRQMEEALAMNVVVSQENCRLALKLLMPDILRGNKSASVTAIQKYLRDMGAANESLRSPCLNLLRSFRQADIEQKRVPTENAPLEVLAKRREEAWQSTLRAILALEQVRKNELTKQQSLKLSSCTCWQMYESSPTIRQTTLAVKSLAVVGNDSNQS